MKNIDVEKISIITERAEHRVIKMVRKIEKAKGSNVYRI